MRKVVILQPDNTTEHTTKATPQNKIVRVRGSGTFSPDLTPTGFHLFQHLEHFINSSTFKNKDLENSFIYFLEWRGRD